MPRRDRNKFVKRGQLIDLDIVDYAFGGKGIARINNELGNFVLFVPNTLPGQKVKARVVKAKKKYAECKLIDVLQKSPDEVNLNFHEISGAPYINLPIEKQHQYKYTSTMDLFKKIGKVTSAVYSPRLKKNIGFAFVPIEHANQGNKFFINSPYGKLESVVVELPFWDPKKQIPIGKT